jgi:hypothetical protein
MTEAEWLECEDAKEMQRFLCETLNYHRRKAGRRKLRLFGCACCRQHWDFITDSRLRRALEFVERLADEPEIKILLDKVEKEVGQAITAIQLRYLTSTSLSREMDRKNVEMLAAEAVNTLASSRVDVSSSADRAMRSIVGETDLANHRAWRQRLQEMSLLLRDIFGPMPFRPVTFAPAWRTATVTSLAQAIYEERAFDRLPILADALEDAGCTHTDILNHCRQPGGHVRGCWVVDLVLGKS